MAKKGKLRTTVRRVSNSWLLQDALWYAKRGRWHEADEAMMRLIRRVVAEGLTEQDGNGQAQQAKEARAASPRKKGG